MKHPDLLLCNATARTLDPAHPPAGLVAVRGGRIAFVGEADDLPRLRSRGTRVVDCQGGCLLPGFHDAHLHLLALAARLVAVDCSPRAVASLVELTEAMKRKAGETPRGQWIRGWGYDDWALTEGRHPTRADLDAAAPDHPVRLAHRSGHALALNSLALQQAGIAQGTPDPPGGVIERDEHGEPTGVLLEMNAYLEGRLPALATKELEEGVRRAVAWLLCHGVTTVQDATPTNSLARWRLIGGFKERGLVTPRVVFMPGVAHLGSFAAEGLGHGSGDESLWLGAAKIMLTQTAGALAPSREELAALVMKAHDAGFGVAIHAVEAEAVMAAAQVLGAAREGADLRPRDRIEHASELPPEALEQVARSRATVVTNPGFLYFSGARYQAQVAPETQPWLYRIGALHRRGVPLAFGSDAPVELPDPLAEVYAAVTRRSDRGVATTPEEGIGVEDALVAHTWGGAWAAGAERWLGRIQEGMAADLVLLDGDPLQVEAEGLRELRVRMVLAGGQVVWEG